MRRVTAEASKAGNSNFCHFAPEANLLPDLEATFAEYAQTGGGKTRVYVHDAEEAAALGAASGTFTDWRQIEEGTDLLFYEGLHGAIITDNVNVSRHADPFVARWIPTPDESMVVIRFRTPRSVDFPYLISMISGSFMSRANSIVIPGGKLDIAMQLILTPWILRLVERKRRAG